MILVTDKDNIPQFVDTQVVADIPKMILSIKDNFPDWVILESQWNCIHIKSKITNVEAKIYLLRFDNLLTMLLGKAGSYKHRISCQN